MSIQPRVLARIEATGELVAEDRQDLLAALDAFVADLAGPASKDD